MSLCRAPQGPAKDAATHKKFGIRTRKKFALRRCQIWQKVFQKQNRTHVICSSAEADGVVVLERVGEGLGGVRRMNVTDVLMATNQSVTTCR